MSANLSKTQTHLIAYLERRSEIEALRAAIHFNMKGWDTARIEKLACGRWFAQMSRPIDKQ